MVLNTENEINNSIEMKIAKEAASKWEQELPRNLDEAKNITQNSEISAIEGIIETLNLNSEEYRQRLIYDVYNNEKINEKDSNLIIEKIGVNINENVLDILSYIHDSWVKNNPDNFMKVNDNGKRRNKERQFRSILIRTILIKNAPKAFLCCFYLIF